MTTGAPSLEFQQLYFHTGGPMLRPVTIDPKTLSLEALIEHIRLRVVLLHDLTRSDISRGTLCEDARAFAAAALEAAREMATLTELFELAAKRSAE